jgi:anti-sigma factor RsiW
MNCRNAENLLLAERDGVLSAEQRAALGGHLAACPSCRALQADLAAAMTTLREDAAGMPVPDADEEWRLLHAQIRAQGGRRIRPAGGAFWLKWLATPLAAAAALAMAFYVGRATAPAPGAEFPVPQVARADFVEVADAGSTPIVYRDEESGWLVVWAADEGRAHG